MKKVSNISKKRLADSNFSKSIKDTIVPKREFKINGFNIIELIENEVENNEDTSYLENNEEINKLNLKEKKSLINSSKKCENYYLNQFGENFINLSCFKCHLTNFHTNDLLYFSNRKILLKYLKYVFIFLKNKLFIDHSTYINNKHELEKCDNTYLINWKFFIGKTICKLCFMEIINMKMLFGNLKTVFCDEEKETYLRKLQNKKRNHRYNKKNNKNKKKNSVLNKEKNNSLISNFFNINVSFNPEKNYLIIKKSALGDLTNEISEKEINEENLKNSNIKYQKENIKKDSKTTINNYNIINNVNYKDILKNNISNFSVLNKSIEAHNISLENINYNLLNDINLITKSLKTILNYLIQIRFTYLEEKSYIHLKHILFKIEFKMIEIKKSYQNVMKYIFREMIFNIILFYGDNKSPKEKLENMAKELNQIQENFFDLINSFDNYFYLFHNSCVRLINILNNKKEKINSKLYYT